LWGKRRSFLSFFYLWQRFFFLGQFSQYGDKKRKLEFKFFFNFFDFSSVEIRGEKIAKLWEKKQPKKKTLKRKEKKVQLFFFFCDGHF
jgi:hypothetical protein